MNAIMWDGDGLSQKCAKQVVAVSSDTLTGKGYVIKGSGYPKGKQGTKGWFRGITFQKAIDQERPDIAVITANAHISQLQDFKAMLAEVAATYKTMVKKRPFTLVWKTNQPGGCAPEPVKSLNAMHTDPMYSKTLRMYNWAQFLHRDRYAKKFWSEQKGIPKVHILDLQPLYLRPDAHTNSRTLPQCPSCHGWDCLHFCVPGPLSLVPRLLSLLMPDLGIEEVVKESDLKTNGLIFPPYHQKADGEGGG